jgi:excisionase family DNA binding protein
VGPPLLRVQEAAQLLKVSKWTIYRWVEEGRLGATKIGQGSLRIFRSSLNGLIDGHRIEPSAGGSASQSKTGRLGKAVVKRKQE